MSESKHTPGPWVVWSEEGETRKGRAKVSVCHHVGDLMSEDHICVATVLGDDVAVAAANARLIAAAPELLEALRYVRANFADGNTREIVARIDAALSQATPTDKGDDK